MSTPGFRSASIAIAKILCGLVLVTATLAAQNEIPDSLPPADVGVPYDFTFLPGLEEIFNAYSGITITTSTSGDVPPGLTVSNSSRVSGVPTRAGSYTFQITITFSISADGQTISIPVPPFPVSIVVRGSATGGLSVEGGAVTFNFAQGATAPQTRTVRIVNKGTPARSVSATATSQPRGWLSTGGSASVAAFSSTGLTITANPASLLPGLYSGSVEITASGGNEKFAVPVVLAIAAVGTGLSISQTGVRFEVQQGSPVNLSQSFQVAGTTAATLQYSATATAIAGGAWLGVSPATGSATATTPAIVTASVSADRLSAGQYYGQIEIRADGVNNSPRTVNVV